MEDNHHATPGFFRLVRQFAATGLGMLQNRGELFAVEWQEERARIAELMWRVLGFAFLAMMGLLLLTATIILLFPPQWRIYVTAALALLYFLCALAVWFSVRSLLRQDPFAESIRQVKKDREWIGSGK